MNGVKDVISYVYVFEIVVKWMLFLKLFLELVVNELGWLMKEEESDIEGNEDVFLEVSIRLEMLWDDYDRDIVYKVFKCDVEDIF